MMMNSKLSFLIVVLVMALSACGGGGGGGAATPAGPGPSANAARSGTVLYTYISKLYAVNMATGQTRTVLDLLSGNRSYAGAAVGPAGEIAIAYNSEQPLANRSWLTILKSDGSVESDTAFNYTIEGRPMFSPDGTKLVFSKSFYQNSTTAKAVQLVSRAGENLFFYENFSAPQWMSNDSLLLFGSDGLYIDPQTSNLNSQLAAVPNSANIAYASASPDGTRIAFVRRQSNAAPRHVYMMNVDGSGTRQVTTSENSEETRVLFSPDGKELLVTSYGCISVFPDELTGPPSIGSVDDDLLHVISADAPLLDMGTIRNLSTSAIRREDGLGRCTAGTLAWR